ncbi:MAG: ABC transporter transmembrane domain-containing protein, partial [Oscillospiraceae bacterium]
MAANRPPGPKGYLTEEEKRNMPKISKALIKRILSYLKPYRLQFLVVFIAILLSSVIGLLPSLITGKIVDKALYGRDMQLLLKLVAAAFATLFISQIIEVLETYVNAWISQRIIYDMRNEMYRHLQFMPHSF